mmetsp:Transcript_4692/g.7028  ORF Transcript_4692/g.7028 Transcript_4692/m.7028 type:complete len:91 (-) Transcript_4692:206-478(-)
MAPKFPRKAHTLGKQIDRDAGLDSASRHVDTFECAFKQIQRESGFDTAPEKPPSYRAEWRKRVFRNSGSDTAPSETWWDMDQREETCGGN